MNRIYLDHNASTPLADEVRRTLTRLSESHHGNPSSSHWAGKPAAAIVAKARAQVAALLGAHDDEIVFTSGGSESNNHAIKGALFKALAADRRPHFITSTVEHPATLEPLAFAERLGATVTRIGVDACGRVDEAEVIAAICDETVLVTIMHANNEVGTLQPIGALASACRERGILLHSDAAQSVGKIDVQVDRLGADLLSLAGHKLCAPKGVGALFVRRGVQLEPLIHGAGHEAGRRAGTENVLLAAALGTACELARTSPAGEHMRSMRDRLHVGLSERREVVLNGHPALRLPNTLNVSFVGELGDRLLAAVPELAASTGSACHAGERSISPVLAAMGCDPERAHGAVRLSVGRDTHEAEIDRAIELLCS